MPSTTTAITTASTFSSFFSLFLLLLLLQQPYTDAASDEVRICDSNNVNTKEDVTTACPMYSNYIRSLYGQGLSTLPITLPGRCNDEAYYWVNYVISCQVSGCKDRVDTLGWYAECDRINENIANWHKGMTLTVHWPSDWPRSYKPIAGATGTQMPTHTVTLHYEGTYPHEFVAKTSKTTVWTTVYLAESAQQKAVHPLYQLPSDLFTKPIQFSSKGFAGLEDYLVFTAPVKSRLTQVQQRQGLMGWGLSTSGCRPPVFTITTNWNAGASCSVPTIYVTQITEESAFECRMQFINGDTTLVPAALTPLAYAVALNLGRISNSLAHAQTIVDCLVPTPSQMQFSYWGQWSESTPGTCVPCAPRRLSSSGATPIPRVCDRALGEMGDCCFSCRQGYTSLQYWVDSTDKNTQQQHCVATCPPGFVYDNPKAFNPRCIACPKGMYSQPDGLECQTCQALGFENAYAGPRGCQRCGSRALATGETPLCPTCYTGCKGCSPQEYVPPGGLTCMACPAGSVLRTAQDASCTPCSPGFYASDGRCLQCPTNTFQSATGATACVACASGYESTSNRTLCVPCTDLNRTLTPFAIYQPGVPGCAAMCNRSVSYAWGTNPYVPNGCLPCAQRPVPNGMYPSREDCARLLPCVNTPVVNSTGLLQYTGSGNDKGICPWQCKPGWYLQDATCYDCNAKGFNATLHTYTEGCAFACLPGLFYRGPSNADTTCTKPCVRLDTVLFPRCSDYFVLERNNGTRFQLRSPATYLLGYCGSNATDPTSELGVVRHKGVFGFFQPASGGGKCGDAMLSSQFEECDDGNTQDGDGCSAQCTVELTDYWDCDVLGELCLPNCGWPDLQGYVLPAPSLLQGSSPTTTTTTTTTVPWCTGITYARDFLRVPLPARGLWLQTHLISCQCERNPHQTLPYSECNYTNQGCRQCLPGYYQDDLYARCTPCGSACALGFWPFNLTRGDGSDVNVKYQYHLDVLDLCGPTVATSQDLSFADPILDPIAFGVDQLKLGCAPCSAGSYNLPSQVLFTTPDCQWKCRRDYSNLTEPKFYCQSPLSPLLGVCNQRCLDCAQSLKTLQTPSTYGWYVQSCADGVGHAYARCANLSDPNALFIGNSELVGDSTGCPWACKSGYQALRGRCVPCGQTACKDSEVLQLCAYSTTSYYCAPCSLIKPAGALQPLQVWYSVLPGYKDCVAGCEPGFAYQLGPNETCKACASYLQCDLDQLLVPCTQTSDAHCLPCPALPPSNSEFYSPGTCKTRCVQGFAASSSSLSPQPQCLSCSLSCPSGKRTSSKCLTPDQRLQLPTCVPCDPIDLPLNRPTEGRMWAPDGEECATTCRGGWMFQDQKDNANLTCVACNLTQCAYGQQGTCSYGKLQCTSCPSFALLDVSQQFKGRGDCTLVCAPGYYDDGAGRGGCLPVSPATDGTDAEDKNGLNSNSSSSSGTDIWGVSLVTESGDPPNQNNASFFPTRVLPHS